MAGRLAQRREARLLNPARLKMALGLLEEDGEGVLITGADRYRREVEPDPDGGLVWCTVEVHDLFDGVDATSLIAFFAGPQRPSRRGRPLR